MKLLLYVILIALLSFLAELFFPWWTAAVCALIVLALWPGKSLKAFLAGFLGVGLLWFAGALYFSIQTDFILTTKVARLLQVSNSVVVIVITAIIGGIIGGMGALSGNHLNKLLHQTPRRKRLSRY